MEYSKVTFNVNINVEVYYTKNDFSSSKSWETFLKVVTNNKNKAFTYFIDNISMDDIYYECEKRKNKLKVLIK